MFMSKSSIVLSQSDVQELLQISQDRIFSDWLLILCLWLDSNAEFLYVIPSAKQIFDLWNTIVYVLTPKTA